MARLARLWHRVAQFHEGERLLALAATWPGRVAVLAAACLLLFELRAPEVAYAAIVSTAMWPARRRPLLAGLSLVHLAFALHGARDVPWRDMGLADWSWLVGAGALLLGITYACFLLARGFRRLPRRVQRSPLLALHASFLVLLGVLWLATSRGVLPPLPRLLWALLPYLLWRAAYMVHGARGGKMEHAAFRDHLFYLWPAFGGTHVPMGKGHDYLSQHEAKSAAELAGAQLAGLKLLVLAVVWTYALRALQSLAYGDLPGRISDFAGGWSLGVPRLGNALVDPEVSPPMAWAAIYVDLVRAVLWLAILGHLIVGVLRLCGFRVFRNTYKPLLAETILDFWNRFYYYFKELLVELFFFPTYLCYFKTHPRQRLFAATFAAAFFGNVYYHVLREGGAFATGDFAALWRTQGPRLVYCFLLALGVYFSMLRQQGRRGAVTTRTPLARLRAIAGVWTFFALIHVWNQAGEGIAWRDRLDFWLGLLGLRGVFF